MKDTANFINKIESRTLPPNALLITYDVTSMYILKHGSQRTSSVHEAYTQANKIKSICDIRIIKSQTVLIPLST